MIGSIPDILSRIVEHKRLELSRVTASLEDLERRAEEQRKTRRDFRAALAVPGISIIAEIKKASPSKGLLAEHFAPAETARTYEQGGAAAISVLTDEKFFQGSLADLQAARSAIRIPVLRKDFTIERFHVAEAAAHGADAILLIVAALDAARLRGLREYAQAFGLGVLVEVHDELELDAAIDSGADIIGVNNRNLRTFELKLETSLQLAGRIPKGAVKVSESGIHSARDVARLRDAGFDAFLVGEHLMTSGDPAAAVRALRQ
jgi:indole-3-glycerol phosphate synthase